METGKTDCRPWATRRQTASHKPWAPASGQNITRPPVTNISCGQRTLARPPVTSVSVDNERSCDWRSAQRNGRPPVTSRGRQRRGENIAGPPPDRQSHERNLLHPLLFYYVLSDRQPRSCSILFYSILFYLDRQAHERPLPTRPGPPDT